MSLPEYKAFTLTGSGLIRAIHAPAKVSISTELSTIFGIKPEVVDIDTLWDTGATSTSISKRLAARLKLPPLTKQKILCAGQPYMSNTYKIDLYLPNMVVFRDVPVTEFEDSNSFDVLVGMDIITTGDFSITNANGITICSFKFPAGPEHQDYVREIEHSKAARKAVKHFKQQQKKRKK